MGPGDNIFQVSAIDGRAGHLVLYFNTSRVALANAI